jgi:molecular chaperone GrpE
MGEVERERAPDLLAQAEIARLSADLEELKHLLVRRQADFDNYRKRIEKERLEDSDRAVARVIEALIPAIDSFEQALSADADIDHENYRKGFELIYKQIVDSLARLGASRIDPIGKPFDPSLHQALERIESVDCPEGTILQVLRPGYIFHERVLRPAMVRVAVRPNMAWKDSLS